MLSVWLGPGEGKRHVAVLLIVLLLIREISLQNPKMGCCYDRRNLSSLCYLPQSWLENYVHWMQGELLGYADRRPGNDMMISTECPETTVTFNYIIFDRLPLT